MIELPLVFLGGLLGSAHCVGMCGGFAVSIGIGSRGVRLEHLPATDLYGRAHLYLFVLRSRRRLWRVVDRRQSKPLDQYTSHACRIGGSIADRPGLLALGVVPRRYWPKLAGGGSVCLAGTFVGPFLASPSLSHVLVAGVLTGFLPCGLVYGYLALASSSASIWTGLLTMSIFGAGTGPLMILVRTGGSLDLARVATRSLEDLGGLRRPDRLDIDRPRCSFCPAHTGARSRSLLVLWRVRRVIGTPVIGD